MHHGTMNRGRQREQKIASELDAYAVKINRILADDPLVQHLLPINMGGDDLADKLKDGLLLSAFINKIPGFGRLINPDKLHQARRDEEGNWEPLSTYQISKNQDMMLQAARFIGLNVENVGVMDLIEARKRKEVIIKLLAEIMTFDGMERMAQVAREYEATATAKGVTKSNSIKGLSLKAKGDKDVRLLRKFLNETLEEAGIEGQIENEASLSESLSDSKIYIQILHYLRNDVISLDSLKDEDPLDRANAVISAMDQLGHHIDFQNYDIVYGEDDIHLQIVAAVATLTATIRLKDMNQELDKEEYKGNTEPEKPIISPEQPTKHPIGTLDEPLDNAPSVEEKSQIEDEEDLANMTTKSPARIEPVIVIEPSDDEHSEVGDVKQTNDDSYTIEDVPPKDTQKPSLVSPDQDEEKKYDKSLPKQDVQGAAGPTNTDAALESNDESDAGSRGSENSPDPLLSTDTPHIKVSPGSANSKHRLLYNSPGGDSKSSGKRSSKIALVFVIILGILFLILGGVATYVAETKVNQWITLYAPLRASTGALSHFQTRQRVSKFYIYSYDNLASASNSRFQVSQKGPFLFTESRTAYNFTFQTSSYNSKPVLNYMVRKTLTPVDENSLKETSVTVPSLYYASAISSNYYNSFMLSTPSAVTSLYSYYQSSFADTLARYLIPVYIKYLQQQSTNISATIADWCSGSRTGLKDGKLSEPLSVSIPEAAGVYLFNESNTYSLRKYSLDAAVGIPAWLHSSQSYDSVILASFQSVGLTVTQANQTLITVRSWISSVVNDADFLYGVKSVLSNEGFLNAADSQELSSKADLGMYQFASGNLIRALSSSSSMTFLSYSSVFPTTPYFEPYELGSYLSMYSSSQSLPSLSQSKRFFALFANHTSYIGSLHSSVSLSTFSFSDPFLGNYTSAGVTSSNYKIIASYLKHITKMSYFKSSGIGLIREFPPTSSISPGLFLRLSAYDLLMGYSDPNIASGLSYPSDLKNPLVESYDTNDAHWSSNKDKWNQFMTGRDNSSNVFQGVQQSGRTSIRGQWVSEEKIESYVEDVAVEPLHHNSPVSLLQVWDDSLERNVNYSYTGSSSTYQDFTVYKYKPTSDTFNNQSFNSANAKYYMAESNGVATMAPKYQGAQIYISKPHFLDGDSSLSTQFSSDSFSPDSSLHDSYLDVESWSGSIMSGAKRYQVNLKLSKSDWFREPGYSSLFSSSTRDSFIAPVYWVEDSFEIQGDRYTDLYNNIYKWERGAKIFQIVFLLCGILCFVIGIVMAYKLTKSVEIPVSSAQTVRSTRLT